MFTALWSGRPLPQELETAVAFARGIEGQMKPNHDAADSDSAVTLLKYAAAILAADEPTPPKKPEWRPKWFWNLIAKISLKCWERKYRKESEARVRQWIEAAAAAPIPPRKPIATARSHANTAPTVEPNNKKDSNQ